MYIPGISIDLTGVEYLVDGRIQTQDLNQPPQPTVFKIFLHHLASWKTARDVFTLADIPQHNKQFWKKFRKEHRNRLFMFRIRHGPENIGLRHYPEKHVKQQNQDFYFSLHLIRPAQLPVRPHCRSAALPVPIYRNRDGAKNDKNGSLIHSSRLYYQKIVSIFFLIPNTDYNSCLTYCLKECPKIVPYWSKPILSSQPIII